MPDDNGQALPGLTRWALEAMQLMHELGHAGNLTVGQAADVRRLREGWEALSGHPTLRNPEEGPGGDSGPL